MLDRLQRCFFYHGGICKGYDQVACLRVLCVGQDTTRLLVLECYMLDRLQRCFFYHGVICKGYDQVACLRVLYVGQDTTRLLVLECYMLDRIRPGRLSYSSIGIICRIRYDQVACLIVV